jgi:hypothetical protein
MSIIEVERYAVAGDLKINGIVVPALDTVTMRGLESIASCMGAPHSMSTVWMPYIAIGQGEVGPSTEDHYLENELIRKAASTGWLRNIYYADVTFAADEPASDCIVREVGLLSALKGGILAARWVLTADIIKETVDTVIVHCEVIIS